jgi:hypothetical protein
VDIDFLACRWVPESGTGRGWHIHRSDGGGSSTAISGVVAGERRIYFEHDLEIEVSGWRFQSKVGFMPGIASNAGEGIVGQVGFFDHFSYVKFDKRKGFVELGGFLGEA